MSGTAILLPPFHANARQMEAYRHWHDPACNALLLSGAIRSGKSAAGLRLIVETALNHPSNYLISRLTYRELEDTVKRALLEGDGFAPPLVPREAIEQVRTVDNLVRLRNGSQLIFRSLDEPAKLLSASYGAALIDQAEELDGGQAGEHIYDTVLGRLSDGRGPRKVLLISNPGPTTHWLARRFVNDRSRDPGARVVHFALWDNKANLPDGYVERMEATRETRPYWYASFVEGRWGAFAGAAYTEFSERIHVCDPFEIPAHWLRFESMDHGQANPTCWLAWAVDEDSNVVVRGEWYKAGELVSHHARAIRALRKRWYGREDASVRVYADPSTGAKIGVSNKWGDPATVKTEYREHGIVLDGGNNNRPAGHSRLLELIHVEPGRIPPRWAQVPPDVRGAPRLYVFSTCRNLIEQLQAAPVEDEGVHTGNAVAAKWESQHGHAHAAARYGAMSWTPPAKEARRVYADNETDQAGRLLGQVAAVWEQIEREERPRPIRAGVDYEW